MLSIGLEKAVEEQVWDMKIMYLIMNMFNLRCLSNIQ